MPMLLNPRHEHFAKLIAGGTDKTKAYVLAGFSEGGAAQSACRLLKTPVVRERIAELREMIQAKTIERSVVDRSWIIEKLKLNVMLALKVEDGQPARTFNGTVANQALRLLGLELGMFRETLDASVTFDGDVTKLSEAQLAKLIASLEKSQQIREVTDERPAIEATCEALPPAAQMKSTY
jgi:hypothetical protein